jgi:hypothetical protein
MCSPDYLVLRQHSPWPRPPSSAPPQFFFCFFEEAVFPFPICQAAQRTTKKDAGPALAGSVHTTHKAHGVQQCCSTAVYAPAAGQLVLVAPWCCVHVCCCLMAHAHAHGAGVGGRCLAGGGWGAQCGYWLLVLVVGGCRSRCRRGRGAVGVAGPLVFITYH